METHLEHGALEDVELFQPCRRERQLDGEVSVRVCRERLRQLSLDQRTLGSLIPVHEKALHVDRDFQQLVRVLLTGHGWCRAPEIVRRVHGVIAPVLPGKAGDPGSGQDRTSPPLLSTLCSEGLQTREVEAMKREVEARGGDVLFPFTSPPSPPFDPFDLLCQTYGGLRGSDSLQIWRRT